MENTEANTISHPAVNITWYSEEESIIAMRFAQGAVIDEQDALEIMDIRDKHFPGTNRLILVDLRLAKSMTTSAKHQFNSLRSVENNLAFALLVRSGIEKVVASMFARYNKTLIPNKFFSDELMAIEWLRSFKEPSLLTKTADSISTTG